jgi:hypothetical protein
MSAASTPTIAQPIVKIMFAVEKDRIEEKCDQTH